MASFTNQPLTITSFTHITTGRGWTSHLVFWVNELTRTSKAVRLQCPVTKAAHWVPLTWFDAPTGDVGLKPWAAKLMAEGGKKFEDCEALDFVCPR